MPPNLRQCLDTFLVVTAGGGVCSWHLMGGNQGRCQLNILRRRRTGSPATRLTQASTANSAEVEMSRCRGTNLGNAMTCHLPKTVKAISQVLTTFHFLRQAAQGLQLLKGKQKAIGLLHSSLSSPFSLFLSSTPPE